MFNFPNLEYLCWQNFARYDSLNAFTQLIDLNWATLKSLTFSLLHYDDLVEDIIRHEGPEAFAGGYAEEDEPPSFLPVAKKIFRSLLGDDSETPPVPKRKRQMKLRDIALWDVPLTNVSTLLSKIIDFSALSYLAMRGCANTHEFLNALTTRADMLSLKTFDTQYKSAPESLVNFIRSFKGLKNIYLLVECLADAQELQVIFDSVFHHADTLKRLVIEAKHESSYVYLTPENLQRIRAELELWEIGLCMEPRSDPDFVPPPLPLLIPIAEPLTPKKTNAERDTGCYPTLLFRRRPPRIARDHPPPKCPPTDLRRVL